jgi:hypothetical protein
MIAKEQIIEGYYWTRCQYTGDLDLVQVVDYDYGLLIAVPGSDIKEPRAADRGAHAMTTWTPSRHYSVGDRITAPNPLTWFDRFIMWFGCKRSSPTTERWKCVETWPPMPEGSIHE